MISSVCMMVHLHIAVSWHRCFPVIVIFSCCLHVDAIVCYHYTRYSSKVVVNRYTILHKYSILIFCMLNVFEIWTQHLLLYCLTLSFVDACVCQDDRCCCILPLAAYTGITNIVHTAVIFVECLNFYTMLPLLCRLYTIMKLNTNA